MRLFSFWKIKLKSYTKYYIIIIMKNRKNGFTLIELLVVITIIAALSITVGVNLSASIKRAQNTTSESALNKMKRAVALYSELSGNRKIFDICEGATNGCKVDISSVISSGLLEDKTIKDAKAACGNKDVYKVAIYYESKEKVIKFYDRSGTEICLG